MVTGRPIFRSRVKHVRCLSNGYELSQGQMSITVHGAGELIPAMEAFDAVSNGAAEMGNGAFIIGPGRHPSTLFYQCTFGLNAQQMNVHGYIPRRYASVERPGKNTT